MYKNMGWIGPWGEARGRPGAWVWVGAGGPVGRGPGPGPGSGWGPGQEARLGSAWLDGQSPERVWSAAGAEVRLRPESGVLGERQSPQRAQSVAESQELGARQSPRCSESEETGLGEAERDWMEPGGPGRRQRARGLWTRQSVSRGGAPRELCSGPESGALGVRQSPLGRASDSPKSAVAR